MRICKYCKKPISDNNVWNPDREGNGYHHACLCEIEFKLRDKRIYDKGRAEVLDKIKAEIEKEYLAEGHLSDYWNGIDKCLQIIDKYKAESEVNNGK